MIKSIEKMLKEDSWEDLSAFVFWGTVDWILENLNTMSEQDRLIATDFLIIAFKLSVGMYCNAYAVAETVHGGPDSESPTEHKRRLEWEIHG